jgi:hypothetical protein
MTSFPVIRLEVEGMRLSMLHAFSQLQIDQHAYVKEALEAYCQEGNLKAVFAEAVEKALDQAIREEVQKFFTYGEGRKAVVEAIQLKLLYGEGEVQYGS